MDDAENIDAEEPRTNAKLSDLGNEDFDSANEDGNDDEDADGAKKPKASSSKAKKLPGGETPAEFAERINKQVKELIKEAKASGKASFEHEAGSIAYTLRKKCINDFMKEIHKKRCGQCNAISPNVRRDGFLKIMEKAPLPNEIASNEHKGYLRISPVKRVAAIERRFVASAASTSAVVDDDESGIASQAISADNAPRRLATVSCPPSNARRIFAFSSTTKVLFARSSSAATVLSVSATPKTRSRQRAYRPSGPHPTVPVPTTSSSQSLRFHPLASVQQVSWAT